MSVHREPLSFDEVISKSSNVGAIMVGLRLGPERMSRYIRRFGFGQALARDLPGQGRGIVNPPSALESERELASVSMGYAVSVTPLQMAAAANAVANGGELVEPRLVRAVIRNGIRAETPHRTIRRAISRETSAELTSIMELVVEKGTAKAAQVPGYRVAGKTGTSEKIVKGRYSDTDHIASFVGFVPARRPEMTILVMIDTPRGGRYTGGAVAAPVFRRIAEAGLRHLAIPSTTDPVPPLFEEVIPPTRVTPASARVRIPAVVEASTYANPGHRLMPDLRGMSARRALATLRPLQVTPRIEGDGFVWRQDPAPGTAVDDGVTASLWMERHMPARAGDGQ